MNNGMKLNHLSQKVKLALSDISFPESRASTITVKADGSLEKELKHLTQGSQKCRIVEILYRVTDFMGVFLTLDRTFQNTI